MGSQASLVDRLAGRVVLIVGDVMLDHFVTGRVERISPEAPVPVVVFEHEQFRLGGAANVAHNVTTLGGRAEIVAVAGQDEEANRLKRELDALAIGVRGIVLDGSRRTTRKLRVVTTRNQQVARVDYETDREVAGVVEEEIIRQVEELSGRVEAILVSDYLKGVVSSAVAAAVIQAGRRHGVPVLVDPKVPHIDYYRGATVVTPNHQEAEAVTHMRIRTTEEATAAARRFRERTACENVLITRGEHGMVLLGPDGDHVLAASAREVSDVTGAGDTVIATLALGLAAGATLEEAARLANRAAGVAVGKFGPAVVMPEELVDA